MRALNLKIKPPYFISFEGGEGAGKTTLINKLKDTLENQGYSVILTREPGGSLLGDAIRDLVLHRDKKMKMGSKAELLLFLSARAQHVEEVIKPALDSGKIVLCDRFYDSSVAYQGYARGLGPKEVEDLCLFATSGLVPDLTFYLDLDPKEGLLRAASDREPDLFEEQKLEFHAQVRAAFKEIAVKNQARIKVIDASKTPENVLTQVLENI
jgi:dTMP kinase